MWQPPDIVVAFAQSTYTVQEDMGPQEVCVVILQGQLAAGQTATVSIRSSDGLATRKEEVL